MDIKYKLVTQDYKTRKGFLNETDWSDSSWKYVTGTGGLCSSGVFHAYDSPEIALFMNPIQANIVKPRLLEVECDKFVASDLTKVGYKKMRRIKELFFREPSVIQKVAFGILCALQVYDEPSFVVWANSWLSGKNRVVKDAYITAHATRVTADSYAANAAVYASYAVNADDSNAAVYAANAAVYASYAVNTVFIKNFSLIDIALEAMQY